MISHLHVARRRLLTTKQAARMLNVQEDVVAKWCELGLMTPFAAEDEMGRRFTEAEVHSLVARLRRNEVPALNS
ncbi:MAG: hypothetical protein A2147_11480 [Chloroflexi bacterium RBG_16_57_8]|nr:MAG: hypothetical protein A2147_11480 [Chloroflexi bacterium RBG_16_57_8]